MQATMRHDPMSGIHWLEFDGIPDDTTRGALKANGWRWSGYRKQWYTNKRFYQVPAGITVEDGGKCDYSAERAERLNTAAEKASERSTEYLAQADKMAAVIPFGQPILVGHYSEGPDRRYRGRIHAKMDHFVEEANKAQHLAEKAESSERHQRHKMKPGVIARRIERLKAERVKIVNQWENEIAHRMYDYRSFIDPETKKLNDDKKQELSDMIGIVRSACKTFTDPLDAEIAENEALLAEAGGLPFDDLNLQVGDIIQCWAGTCPVTKINKKTVTVEDRHFGYNGQGYRTVNIDKTKITARSIVKRASDQSES